MPKNFNLPRQKQTRRALRKHQTDAEKILWSKLRGRQFLEYKFRRQHGVGKYVVDFYCPAKRLTIEIDGATHYTEEEITSDRKRQAEIEQLGIRFVRVINIEVYKNLDGVLQLILGELRKITTNYYAKDDSLSSSGGEG